MHVTRFDSIDSTNDTLRLSGRFLQARITLLDGGVWRLLAYSRSQDASKGSWVLDPHTLRPFRTVRLGARVRLEAEGAPALELGLDPFDFRWGHDERGLLPRVCALGLNARRTRAMGDARAMREMAIGQGDPLAETVDGQPFGAGLSLVLDEPPHRRYYGLGERTGFLDKRGRVWTNWTTDQSRHLPSADALYQAHPFVLGLEDGKAFGVYLDETWKTVFDLASSEPDRSVLHTDGPTFDVYLIPGPTPRQVLGRYTALVGRAPLPPLWALGYHQCRWSYPDQAGVLALAEEFRSHQIPLDALWLDIDYMDGYKVFTFSPGRFPGPGEMTSALSAAGVHTVAIVDPGVKQEAGYEIYESGMAIKAFVRDRRENLLVGEVWPNPAVWPDFTRPDVRAWWGERYRCYLDAGIGGIWLDMNEPAAFNWPGKTLPDGARQGGHWHAEVHNLYGSLMSQATSEALGRARPEVRPFVLTRSGFAGIQRHAWVWTGDNASYWEHLEGSLPMLMNMGLSGMPFVGADIGGFFEDASGELLVRWLWVGALYPFMRNHAGKGTRRQEPWAFGEPFTTHAREAIRFRYRLLPYLYTLAEEAAATGLPLLRPLLLEYPTDPECELLHDQMLVGRDLLAAPILRPGQTRRLVYLPAGPWFDFWTGQRHEGPGWMMATAGLDRIPLFQRGGSAIPMAEPGLHTGDARWRALRFRVTPGEHIAGEVYEDAGDGPHGQGSRTRIEGSLTAGRLSLLVHEEGAPRPLVLVEVAGAGLPARSSGPSRFLPGGGVELEVSSGVLLSEW